MCYSMTFLWDVVLNVYCMFLKKLVLVRSEVKFFDGKFNILPLMYASINIY